MIEVCLERLASRDLDVASVAGARGHERLRLVDVLGELVDAVPPARRAPVQRRLERATGDLQRAFPGEARALP